MLVVTRPRGAPVAPVLRRAIDALRAAFDPLDVRQPSAAIARHTRAVRLPIMISAMNGTTERVITSLRLSMPRGDFMSDTNAALRAQLVRFLDTHDAHADFDAAIEGIPPDARSAVPDGLPYSTWQLVEHLRIAQHDILDFCVNASYREMKWPDHYWPASPAPPSPAAWDESVAAYRRDREAMQRLARDPEIDLFAAIPHGSGQTYLREILLVVDHAAYHIGQIVLVRRLLGNWTSG